MGVIITYDVSDKQQEMKDCLIKKGYFDSWQEGPENNRITVQLPYTTLWKKDGTLSQGLADMKACATSLQIKLLRALSINDAETQAIPGVK